MDKCLSQQETDGTQIRIILDGLLVKGLMIVDRLQELMKAKLSLPFVPMSKRKNLLNEE